MFKVSKKTTTRINAGFYSDERTKIISNSSNYTFNNDTFRINQIENAQKKPNIFNANIQFLNKSSKTQNWEYLGKVKTQDVDYNSKSVNNDIIQTNNVKTKSFFTKHNFNYTSLINDKNVVVLSGLYLKSNAPQNYTVTPGTNIDDNSSIQIIKNEQDSSFNKETLFINADYLGKIRDYKWVLSAGFSSTKNNFKSSLLLSDINNIIISNDNFNNNINYFVQFPFSDFNIALTKKKFSFKIGLGLRYYDLTLNDNYKNSTIVNGETIFSPSLKFSHKISKRSSLIYNYNFNQIAPKESNLFEGIVQTGYRSFQNNSLDFEFLKTHSFSFAYNYVGELGLNRIFAVANYNVNKNNYFNKLFINQNTTTVTSFLLNSQSNNYNFILSGITYIHPIKTTIDFNFNYDINLYNDIVNNSELRNVISKGLNVELTMRKGLNKVLYFETKTLYNSSNYLLENEKVNKFSSLSQALKIAFNCKESFKANTTMNFISPDLAINNNYWFLNFEITFLSKNRNIEYSIIAKNLTNNKTFDTYNITDYSKSISSQNLIERYILASISFRI